MNNHLRLGVNIDHVATIRNARGGGHPDPVHAAHLAGKLATFDIKVKAIKAEVEAKVDDEFAKRIGLESQWVRNKSVIKALDDNENDWNTTDSESSDEENDERESSSGTESDSEMNDDDKVDDDDNISDELGEGKKVCAISGNRAIGTHRPHQVHKDHTAPG